MAGKKGKVTAKARVFKRPTFKQQPPLSMYSTSGIHDNQPTRNVKELHFAIYDWFTLELPKLPDDPAIDPGDFVYSYGLEESQNFLGQVTDAIGVDRGTGVTKNRIKSVTLEVLSPDTSLEVAIIMSNLTKRVSLPLIVSGTPTPTSIVTLPTASPNAMIGQNSTVVHPDVRRAWVQVAHWDWRSMFSDTQLQPLYTQYDGSANPARNGIGLELFRVGVYDSIDGSILYSPSTGPVGLDFRVKIDLAAPVGLMPTPLRFKGYYNGFAGLPTFKIPSPASLATDKTPVQYQIKGVQNLM
jgi:hypothetical protein